MPCRVIILMPVRATETFPLVDGVSVPSKAVTWLPVNAALILGANVPRPAVMLFPVRAAVNPVTGPSNMATMACDR